MLAPATTLEHRAPMIGSRQSRTRTVSRAGPVNRNRQHHGRCAMKIYLAYARLCYALVVAVSAIVASYAAFLAVKGIAGWSAKSWLLVAGCAFGFLILCGRAITRKFRGRLLLSHPIGDKQSSYLLGMTLLGSFGHFFTALVCNAIYIVITQVREMPGPVAIAVLLAGACYLLALWIGELVLERNQPTSPQSQYRPVQ